MPYYLQHRIEIFSIYSLLLDVTVLIWKLKKKCKVQSNRFFKVLHSNWKCTAAVKCLSPQNGRIKFYLSGHSCSDTIKCIQQLKTVTLTNSADSANSADPDKSWIWDRFNASFYRNFEQLPLKIQNGHFHN